MMKHAYLVGAMAVAGLIAAAIAPTPYLAHSEPPAMSGEAMYTCCADFHDLARQSVAVVRARVTATSPLRFLPPDRPVLVQDPPPQLPPEKGGPGAQPTPDTSTIPADPDPGLPLTDATVQVIRTLRGPARPGQSLTVEQVGGTDANGQQWADADDPLLQIGQEEILFLMRNPNGTYSTVGGPQGRFAINATGTIQSRAPAEWRYLRAYNGRTVDALAAAVSAAQ